MSDPVAEAPDDYDDYDDGFDPGAYCADCQGGGWHLRCVDDMCHGQYEGGPYSPCGDGKCVRPCRSCNKDGFHGF